ncbi:MAG TPA: YggT family protein [Gallionella sp.]|nr:YggT family protein [Gallionella sp.]
MMSEGMMFLLDALLQPFAAILLFRFHAVWLRTPMRNPIGEFIMAITDFIVLPLRKHLPAVAGLDSATFLLALLAELLYLSALFMVQGDLSHGFPLVGLLTLTLVKLLKISVYLLMAVVFAQAILSWVNPHSPVAPMLSSVSHRFLQPLRKVVLMAGSVDLSPMLLLVACQLIVIVPIGALERLTLGLFF